MPSDAGLNPSARLALFLQSKVWPLLLRGAALLFVKLLGGDACARICLCCQGSVVQNLCPQPNGASIDVLAVTRCRGVAAMAIV